MIPQEPVRETISPPTELSAREIALRDLFCAEYLIDYNQVAAAMRCGFPRYHATEWATKFMEEAYVQQKLRDMTYTPVDPDKEREYNAQRVKQQLLREAHYRGPGSSHAARVAALGKLAKIYGLEAPEKAEIAFEHRGGVMRIPSAATSEEDWEAAATVSQQKLQGGQGT